MLRWQKHSDTREDRGRLRIDILGFDIEYERISRSFFQTIFEAEYEHSQRKRGSGKQKQLRFNPFAWSFCSDLGVGACDFFGGDVAEWSVETA